jgi:hypothetical protein
MKKLVCFTLILITCFTAFSQTRVSGSLKSKRGILIAGANITLANSYEGASTDTAGRFSFNTSATGNRMLVYSAIGFKTDSLKISLWGEALTFDLELKEAMSELNVVTITAGNLETGDTKKGAVLTSLDVVTTAGAVADIVAALQTLPGTSQAFSENGLFVRGGSSAETRTYFDGLAVKDPFGSQLPDISSRGRFSAFLFKGTTFSSGGYSAQYGQALSSALILESKDLPEKSSTEVSLLSVGPGAAHTERFENSSVTIGGVYYNLKPNYTLVKQNARWDQFPVEETGNIQYKWKPTKNSILKVFSQYSNNSVSLFTNNPNESSLLHVTDHNKNTYTNISYQNFIGTTWKLEGGVSYSNTKESGKIDSNLYRRNDHLLEGRFTITRYFAFRSLFKVGAELYQNGRLEVWNNLGRDYEDNIQSAFVETEVFLSDYLVIRFGGRAEHSAYLGEWNLAPRASLALKTSAHTQLSLAYGVFYQNPDETYLLQSHQLRYESSIHCLMNYQYLATGITFRAEVFYKQYAHLTRYDFNGAYKDYGANNYTGLYNGGNGYAKGVDIFWRDKNSIKGGDYYISYSFLDTKRIFKDYPILATPPFAASHTFNVVYKQYIPIIKSEISTAYAFCSGRTYYNPKNPVFLGDRTRSFNNISFNLSYLTRVFNQYAVVYASVNNLLGFNNIYGYNYSTNGNGREPVLPVAKRNILFGLLVTFGDNTFNH